jgi:hypothetical protein
VKHAKFRETDDEFRLVSCFAKLKKHAKLETLILIFMYGPISTKKVVSVGAVRAFGISVASLFGL